MSFKEGSEVKGMKWKNESKQKGYDGNAQECASES